MRWFSLESPVVGCKYVFTCFKSENDLSLTALVAAMTSNSFSPRIEISLNSFLRELSRDCKRVLKCQTPLTLLSVVKAKVVLKLSLSRSNHAV